MAAPAPEQLRAAPGGAAPGGRLAGRGRAPASAAGGAEGEGGADQRVGEAVEVEGEAPDHAGTDDSHDLKAWKVIDEAGMRGATMGGAQMSPKHSNFLVNTGDATAADLEGLGEGGRTMKDGDALAGSSSAAAAATGRSGITGRATRLRNRRSPAPARRP